MFIFQSLTRFLTDQQVAVWSPAADRQSSSGESLCRHLTQLDHHRHTMQKDLLPPTGEQQELQGHSVSLYADLDGSLRPLHFLHLSKAALVLLQQADAFLIAALQRTNHSSANDLTSCAQSDSQWVSEIIRIICLRFSLSH